MELVQTHPPSIIINMSSFRSLYLHFLVGGKQVPQRYHAAYAEHRRLGHSEEEANDLADAEVAADILAGRIVLTPVVYEIPYLHGAMFNYFHAGARIQPQADYAPRMFLSYQHRWGERHPTDASGTYTFLSMIPGFCTQRIADAVDRMAPPRDVPAPAEAATPSDPYRAPYCAPGTALWYALQELGTTSASASANAAPQPQPSTRERRRR